MAIKTIVARFLLLWGATAAAMATGFLLLGLGGFLAAFFLLLLAVSATPLAPAWGKSVLGSEGYSLHESTLKKLRTSMSYRVLFVFVNASFLALTIYVSLFVRFKVI